MVPTTCSAEGWDMFTIPATGPVDQLGRLVHEDDAAAQLALAMARTEDAVRAAEHDLVDLIALRVLTIDRATAEGVLDVIGERLTALGVAPTVVVVDVDRLPVPGMLVAIEADLDRANPTSSELNDEITPPKEER
jgi:enamine deaminase RidA (YjgF/YER057c/UK114 family)